MPEIHEMISSKAALAAKSLICFTRPLCDDTQRTDFLAAANAEVTERITEYW